MVLRNVPSLRSNPEYKDTPMDIAQLPNLPEKTSESSETSDSESESKENSGGSGGWSRWSSPRDKEIENLSDSSRAPRSVSRAAA